MRTARALLPALTGATVLAVAALPAAAQAPEAVTTLTVRPTVTPNRAGTPRRPQSVRLDVRVAWSTSGPDGVDKPIVQRGVIDFPKGSLYLGGSYPHRCSKAELDRARLDDRDRLTGKCAKAVTGSGTATAWADTVRTRPTFQLVNGGAKRVYLYTVLKNPARVTTPIEGVVTRGGKYGGYRLTATIPEELQVVAGTPISLIDARLRTTAEDWIATTSCPKDGRWPYRAQSFQDSTPVAVVESFVRCRR
ncbi:unannotated protein [freshwater metagenome]|uniref:Unannotated protein n=1 Tax=freshwater metagenome TaxID=449393 RepID=A0A6J7GH05_9ZZZZ|nr:hypothetical protein [Actinomycetota bacterium]